jgi:hypothetical protein
LRIVRALAIFRPSLIALQMPLSVEDEVFVEKCFQRSLLVCLLLQHVKIPSQFSLNQELDKLISFSGTPTVVWRRTGEICLVAPEFCLLTEWAMEDLVGRRKYIYEVGLFLIRLPSKLTCQLALRKSVCSGILGKLRLTCFREYDTISIFSLCVAQAFRGTHTSHVLLLNTKRYI